MDESTVPGVDLGDAPIYREVAQDLGFDPLDPTDAVHDAYNAATLYHADAQQNLRDVARSAFPTQ